MPSKHNILFFPDKNGDVGYLRMRVRWSEGVLTFNLGYTIEIDKWVKEAQRVKANTTHGRNKIPAVVINKAIELHAQIMEECFYYYERNGIPTKEEIKTLYEKKIGKSNKEKNFEDDFNEFIYSENISNSWTKTTRQKMITVLDKFKSISRCKMAKDITPDTIRYYINELIARGYRNTSISKEVKCIMQFVRWSAAKGLNEGFKFSAKLKIIQRTVVYLTWEELMTIYKMDFKKNYLNRARDLFCLCCFTGLRYSDMAKLTKEDIYDNAIHIVTKKTNASITIELNKYSSEIIGRYDSLPVISNAKLNYYLKEIGRCAHIDELVKMEYYIGSERIEESIVKWKLLTTHCGRRTFVCNALSLGISPQVIMKWTGHESITSMKPYMDIADNFRRSEMSKFDNI